MGFKSGGILALIVIAIIVITLMMKSSSDSTPNLLVDSLSHLVSATLKYDTCWGEADTPIGDFCFQSQSLALNLEFNNPENTNKTATLKIPEIAGFSAEFVIAPGISEVVTHIPLIDYNLSEGVHTLTPKILEGAYNSGAIQIKVRKPHVSTPISSCDGCKATWLFKKRSSYATYSFVGYNEEEYVKNFKVIIEFSDSVKLTDETNWKEIPTQAPSLKRYEQLITGVNLHQSVGLKFNFTSNSFDKDATAGFSLHLYASAPSNDGKTYWEPIWSRTSSEQPDLGYEYPALPMT